MGNSSMYMNSDSMRDIVSRLSDTIGSIEACYKDMDESVKTIDGSNDNWKGDNQTTFYNDSPLYGQNIKHQFFNGTEFDKNVPVSYQAAEDVVIKAG